MGQGRAWRGPPQARSAGITDCVHRRFHHEEPTDAIVRLTASAICGTDRHFVRGTVPGMVPGTIVGHEGVGVVEAAGDMVRNLSIGD